MKKPINKGLLTDGILSHFSVKIKPIAKEKSDGNKPSLFTNN